MASDKLLNDSLMPLVAASFADPEQRKHWEVFRLGHLEWPLLGRWKKALVSAVLFGQKAAEATPVALSK